MPDKNQEIRIKTPTTGAIAACFFTNCNRPAQWCATLHLLAEGTIFGDCNMRHRSLTFSCAQHRSDVTVEGAMPDAQWDEFQRTVTAIGGKPPSRDQLMLKFAPVEVHDELRGNHASND